MIGGLNRSDSFHYKPACKSKNSHLQTSALNRKKIQKQPSQEKQAERSLSLPHFETFNACPQIKQTAYFSETVPQQKEESKGDVDWKNLKNLVQESLHWEGDKIQINDNSRAPRDDSMVDSFLMEFNNYCQKPTSEATQIVDQKDNISAIKPPANKSQDVVSPRVKRSRARKYNLLKMHDLRFAKPS